MRLIKELSKDEIGGDNQYLQAIVTDPWIIDYQIQQPRRPCLEDVRRHTIIGQSLDDVVAMSRMDFPVSEKVQEELRRYFRVEHKKELSRP